MKNTVIMLITGIVFLNVFNVFLPVETCVASGNTRYVDDSGGADYTNIQDAVNAANDSDTIYVYGGTYNENVVINKSLTLTGGGSGITTIHGNEDPFIKSTIKIISNNVSIYKFTIENEGGSFACILLSSVTNCEITNNTIKNGGNGIHLVSSSSNTIKYNTVKDNSVGIYLSSSDSNIIRDNSIQNNDNYGISLSSTSNNNIIYLNDFSHEMGSNARDLSTSNSWSHNNQGNYWDDYNDYDSNGNGVGDNPYVIDGDSQDDHPMGVFLNQDPVAYIDSISPSPATQGQTINFKGNGIDDGTIIDWEWTSSVNGNFGSSEDVSYLGLSVGTHTIKFRVKDDDCKWSEYAERTLTINPLGSSQENQKPTATIIKPNPTTATTATVGESIYFHGIGTDSDGTIVEYSWRSSKDGVFNENSTFTKSDLSVGTHAIYFKVKDNQGEWSSEDTAILIINTSSSPSNEPPTPDAGGPYTEYVNASISFDASNSSDPDGDDIVSYEWDFGDGTNGNGVYVEHTYSSIGNYTVTLTITDSQDKTSTISTYANISIQTPDQNDDNGNDTPGFEIFLTILAMIFVLIKKRHA